jgi:hypothetical protein
VRSPDRRPGRAAFTAGLSLACALAGATALDAATMVIVNTDFPGQGFNDPTPAAPLPGNPGVTAGQQRMIAFQAAADYWGQRLVSAVPVRIEARFDDLPCDPTSAVLGGAGPILVFADFPGEPVGDTWFHSALADSLAGFDLEPTENDIFAIFTSALDGSSGCLGGLTWWYGVGAAVPAGTLDFFTVVQHEIAHGLGFSTFVDRATGQKLQGLDDTYMRFLEDHSLGQLWPQLSNLGRVLSAVDTGDLHWVGARVLAAAGPLTGGVHPGGHVQMYAPNPLEQGSSVTHWDTAVTPDELMEPFLTPAPVELLTTPLLGDVGWQLAGAGPCVPDATTLCLNGGRFRVEVDWETQFGTSGPGMVVPFGSDDSGLFWFFNANNWEMLVKVLNACSLDPPRFWVFFAATTNVEFTLTVTDTQSGAVHPYFNALGHRADAVTDTDAFATCP